MTQEPSVWGGEGDHGGTAGKGRGVCHQHCDAARGGQQ